MDDLVDEQEAGRWARRSVRWNRVRSPTESSGLAFCSSTRKPVDRAGVWPPRSRIPFYGISRPLQGSSLRKD